MTLDNATRRQKQKEAMGLTALMQVGKAGVTDEVAAELARHLKRHKLVKVRLLPAATGEAELGTQATALAKATRSELVETRGATAVFWRP